MKSTALKMAIPIHNKIGMIDVFVFVILLFCFILLFLWRVGEG